MAGDDPDAIGPRKETDVVIPLINIPRDDFKLRTEAVAHFDAMGLSPDRLVFASDVDLGALSAAAAEADGTAFEVVLVDHNAPAASQVRVVWRWCSLARS